MHAPKRARGEETDSISLTFQDTAAHVAKLPVGWSDVLEADQQEILKVMIQFSREIEPNNAKKKWSIRPVLGPGGLITSYIASFAGYAGVVRVDALEAFRHKFASRVSYIGVDLTFVSADRAHSGALVLCIPSQATIDQTVHRHEELHGATIPAHASAFDGVPAAIAPLPASVAAHHSPPLPVPVMVPTLTLPPAAAAAASIPGNLSAASTPQTPRGRSFWGAVASFAGLGDGGDSGDER